MSRIYGFLWFAHRQPYDVVDVNPFCCCSGVFAASGLVRASTVSFLKRQSTHTTGASGSGLPHCGSFVGSTDT